MSDDINPFKRYDAERRARRWLWFLTLIALAALFASYVVAAFAWTPGGLPFEQSFARSGAITSMGSVLLNVYLADYRLKFGGVGVSDFYLREAFAKYANWGRTLYVLSIATALQGALIWAYGDLLLLWWHDLRICGCP